MKISPEAREAMNCLNDALGFLTEVERPILAIHLQPLINSTLDRAAGVANERIQAYAGWPVAHLLNGARHGEAIAIRAAIIALKEE